MMVRLHPYPHRSGSYRLLRYCLLLLAGGLWSTAASAQAEQVAELRFVNLLTGQVALTVPVAGAKRCQQVQLAGLPAGQYACQLMVDGQLAAAPQKLFVNP